eukprot:5983395-Prymnesium_polylepis.1
MLLAIVELVAGFTPYEPAAGWTYHIEVNRTRPWPACPFRFLSFTGDCQHDDLWDAAGPNQEFSLEESADSKRVFRIKLGCGKYLSYSATCGDLNVSSAALGGARQEFQLKGAAKGAAKGADVQFAWHLEALERSSCAERFLSAADDCDGHRIGLASRPSVFHLHGVRNSAAIDRAPSTRTGCADPFAWYSEGARGFFLTCTGGELPLGLATDLSANTTFAYRGFDLAGAQPEWASSWARWAPENLETMRPRSNVVFFSDQQAADGRHRVGYAFSSRDSGNMSASWTSYSPAAMALGSAEGGEIDQHVFRDDDDGRTYLVWKTDDNSVGAKTTRLWMQEIVVGVSNVSLAGERRMILDSSGLWWVDSWVDGGSLIEGPEIVRHGDYYYLFFAAGRFCQSSYAEGVARAKSVWGPYEKLAVPLLSTGIVGYSGGLKQTGPGHASFVRHPTSGEYFAVYHASPGDNCNRLAFVEALRFSGASGWPYIDFAPSNSTMAFGGPKAEEEAVAAFHSSCRIVAPCNVVVGRAPPQQQAGRGNASESADETVVMCGGRRCERLHGAAAGAVESAMASPQAGGGVAAVCALDE